MSYHRRKIVLSLPFCHVLIIPLLLINSYLSVSALGFIVFYCISLLHHLAGRIGRQLSKAPSFSHREGSRGMEEGGKQHCVMLQDLRHGRMTSGTRRGNSQRVQREPRRAKSAASVPGSSTCKSITGQATSWPQRRSIREAYQRLPAAVLGVHVGFRHHSTPAKSVRYT